MSTWLHEAEGLPHAGELVASPQPPSLHAQSKVCTDGGWSTDTDLCRCSSAACQALRLHQGHPSSPCFAETSQANLLPSPLQASIHHCLAAHQRRAAAVGLSIAWRLPLSTFCRWHRAVITMARWKEGETEAQRSECITDSSELQSSQLPGG